VTPRWAPFRLGHVAGGLSRRRGNGIVRLLHAGDEPVVVAVAGTVFAARAPSEAAARDGIARMRSATGIDDDLADFHARFRDDPVIGRAVRADPALRVRRNPDPWETLMFAITEQLIDTPRALAIQRRMTAVYGQRFDGLRDSPGAATIADRAPAELEACGLHAKRALAMIRCAREVAEGRIDLGDPGHDGRLRSVREIGPWTTQCLALDGRGDPDSLPAGDLGYIKLVGRLAGLGRRATIEEVEEFFAPYEPYRGLAGTFALVGLHKHIAAGPPLRYGAAA
jgi:DNA-3-methyladenine glycosylase II